MSDGFNVEEFEALADVDLELDNRPEVVEEDVVEPDEDELDDTAYGDDLDDDDGSEDGEEDADDEEEGDVNNSVLETLKALKEEILQLREQVKGKKDDEVDETPQFEAIEFVDDGAFDEALRSPEGLNKLLNSVFQAGQQAVLQKLPAVVGPMATKAVNDAQLVRDFFRSNPDLAEVKGLVTEVAHEVSKEFGPDSDAKVVMKEIAKRSRARMKGSMDSAKEVKKAHRRGRNPGAVKGGASRPGSGRPGSGKKQATIADEISAMMNL